MKKIMGPSVLLVSAVVVVVLAFSFKAMAVGPEAPCTPCTTWGQIKTCFMPTPAPCCSCHKTPNELDMQELYTSDSLSTQLTISGVGSEGIGTYRVIVTDSHGLKDTCFVALNVELCEGSPTLYAMHFTVAAAVEDFLSSRSAASVLMADVTNPDPKAAGRALAGQILALTLNVEFSCAVVFDELELLPDVPCYADHEIPQECGKFHGLKVNEFLAIAKLALADSLEVLAPYDASISDVNFTATFLNERYDGCRDPFAEEPDFLTSTESSTGRSQNTGADETPALPKEFRVNQSYPNPFNPSATIEYALPSDGNVTIEIYDAIGRKVATLLSEYRSAGYHSVTWLGKDEGGTAVASGVYFCRVQFGPKAAIQKMILLR